jgi:glycogen(starch) synthase
VARQLREVYAEVLDERACRAMSMTEPVAAVPLPEPGADRVVVVAINPGVGFRTRQYIQAARAKGYGVDLIARDKAAWAHHKLDAGVRFHTVGEQEEGRITRRLERYVVDKFPRRVSGFLRSRAARTTSPMPEALAVTGQRFQRRASSWINRKIYNRWYEVTRPRILWRITRRDVLPQLDGGRTRRVVVHGVPGVTIGWRLAKRWPDVPVSTSLRPPAEDARVSR